MIDGHGDDLHRYDPGQIISNFSTNILTPRSHAALMSYLASRDDLIRSYPEPEPLSLEARIAEIEDVDPAAVMVTAGATQAIYMIALSRRATRSAILTPTFREYQDACLMADHSIETTESLTGLLDSDNAWLCCPDNPTGHVIPLDTLRDFLSSRRGLNIIDGAYSSYTLCPVISGREAVERGNNILLRSLTKEFGVPGLRIGYALGHPDLMCRVKAMRMPWSVGALPIAAAGWLLDRRDLYRIDAEALHAEAMRLSGLLTDLGIEVAPTDANFFLCRLPGDLIAAELKEYLVRNNGILIRDASNFKGLSRSHFRVAAQTPAEGDILVSAIRKWIESKL